MLNWPPKDPGEILDYRWDVQLDAGDAVQTATLTRTSGDVTIAAQAHDATGASVFLSGGSVGANLFYAVATTTGGRTIDEYIGLQVATKQLIAPVVPGGVAFDYAQWALLYPNLATSVNAQLAQGLFAQAGLYLENTASSPVADLPTRLMLLNMLVAHLAVLGGYVGGSSQAQGLVGRVTSATEGSVSVSADIGFAPGTADWYSQTSYGLNFWQATRGYRTARYYPARQPIFDPAIIGPRRWSLQ